MNSLVVNGSRFSEGCDLSSTAMGVSRAMGSVSSMWGVDGGEGGGVFGRKCNLWERNIYKIFSNEINCPLSDEREEDNESQFYRFLINMASASQVYAQQILLERFSKCRDSDHNGRLPFRSLPKCFQTESRRHAS